MSSECGPGDDAYLAEVEGYEGETISTTVDGRIRTVKKGLNACKICAEDLLIEEPEQIPECFIDGRLACTKCVNALNSTFATAQYFVCINVLCRRKWKQLSPRVVSFFCPSCRKSLESKLKVTTGSDFSELSDLAYLKLMYKFWMSVLRVLSDKLPFEWTIADETTALTDQHDLQETLDVFTATFSQFDVPMESCRNWNSMLVRKKYYKGYIESKDPVTHLCHIVPTAELKENFHPVQKNLNQKNYPFFVLDWKDELELGEEVYFIAFPNPVQEKLKDYVKHIIKMIRGPDSPIEEEERPESPETVVSPAPGKNGRRESNAQQNNQQNQQNAKQNKKGQKAEKAEKGKGKGGKDAQQQHRQALPKHHQSQQGAGHHGATASMSSLHDLRYMVPAKIESPYASPLLEPMEPSMITPLVTSKDLDFPSQLRTPSLFTPPYQPWKVLPLWTGSNPANAVIKEQQGEYYQQQRGGGLYPKESAPIISTPPPGFSEIPSAVGQAASSAPPSGGLGMADFGDLMQWTEGSGYNEENQHQWYDPIADQSAFQRSNSFLRHSSRNTIPPVPEDQPLQQDFQWPLTRGNSRLTESSKRNYVPPQSPWAAYFGD